LVGVWFWTFAEGGLVGAGGIGQYPSAFAFTFSAYLRSPICSAIGLAALLLGYCDIDVG